MVALHTSAQDDVLLCLQRGQLCPNQDRVGELVGSMVDHFTRSVICILRIQLIFGKSLFRNPFSLFSPFLHLLTQCQQGICAKCWHSVSLHMLILCHYQVCFSFADQDTVPLRHVATAKPLCRKCNTLDWNESISDHLCFSKWRLLQVWNPAFWYFMYMFCVCVKKLTLTGKVQLLQIAFIYVAPLTHKEIQIKSH